MLTHNLEALFHPRSIAVVGASNKPNSSGHLFMAYLLDCGYRGKIYPVSSYSTEVLGVKAYANVMDIPNLVDYVICCIPASNVPDLIAVCGKKKVRFIHIFTGRLAETGKTEGATLQKEILERAREYGIRLLGPNCMGIYYPKGGMSFDYNSPKESGKVGIFSQSGGNAVDIINEASARSIYFSKVISYGNALDLNEIDFLEYLLQDPETQVIAGYVEGIKSGRKFLNCLRGSTHLKPVIMLKGGKGNAGAKAAASHTSALAGSFRIWHDLIRQAGAIEAENLQELVDLLAAFYFIPPVFGTHIGIVGGGGGTAVLSADAWEGAGLTVIPLPWEIEEHIRNTLPEQWWGWIGNPVDVSIIPIEYRASHLHTKIIEMMAQSPSFDLIVYNIMIMGPFPKDELIKHAKREVEDIIGIARKGIKPIVAILNTHTLDALQFEDTRGIAELKAELMKAKIPVYSNASEAAKAVACLVNYYQKNKSSIDSPIK